MNRNLYTFLAILIMTAVTVLIRAASFLIFGRGREIPKPILYLGRMLPAAVMAMLLVYCLKGLSFSAISGWLPMLLACIITAGLHFWKHNPLISIFSGTAIYMILIQLVFR